MFGSFADRSASPITRWSATLALLSGVVGVASGCSGSSSLECGGNSMCGCLNGTCVSSDAGVSTDAAPPKGDTTQPPPDTSPSVLDAAPDVQDVQEVSLPAPVACTYAGDPACPVGTVCSDKGCLKTCAINADCPAGLACHLDGQDAATDSATRLGLCAAPGWGDPRVKECGAGAECPTGNVCVDGQCRVAPACTGASCSCKYSSDCGDARICVDNACVASCANGAACGVGQTCDLTKNVCVPSTAAAACGKDANGAACPMGQLCANGQCVPSCIVDTDCKNADQTVDTTRRCVGGACVVDNRPRATCVNDAGCALNQHCMAGFCRWTCETHDFCLALDYRLRTCSTEEGFCREADVECTTKAQCGDKSCVDGRCR